MPFGRIQGFYSKIMGLEISQGGIADLLQRFTAKALPMYQEIKSRIEKAACLGADEKGLKVKQKVSGGFRSIERADGFVVIRSIIDTTIKSRQDVFHALSLIANFGTG